MVKLLCSNFFLGLFLGIALMCAPLSSAAAEVSPEPQSRYPPITDAEIETIARLVYLEARGECARGQQAVVEVVLNRVVSERFGHVNNVEEVVYDRKYAVQFRPARRIPGVTPKQAQYDAVNAALYGEPVLDMSYLYFNGVPVTRRGVVQIGAHYFSE